MDLYKVDGYKKISVSTNAELYDDDIIICPYCNGIVDKNHNRGEFANPQGYESLECNHCFKITAVRFHKS